MKKILLFVMSVLVLSASTLPLYPENITDLSGGPSWLDKNIYEEGSFIYSVGHSNACRTESDARKEALTDATEAFVKYCRVDVQSFDRSIELYSKYNGKTGLYQNAEAGRFLRANAFVTGSIAQDWHIEKSAGSVKASVLLKIPKEEFDRISKESNIKISVDILFYCEGPGGKMQVMDENSVLSSGEGYAIYINPSDPCYIYVYQIDSLGKSFRLFPNAEYLTASNPVLPVAGAWLPNDKKLYQMDETTGKEYVCVFASKEAIKEFEDPAAVNLTKSNLDDIILIKKMGVAGLKDKRDSSKFTPKRLSDIKEVKKKLQAEGAFVYETWFWHK